MPKNVPITGGTTLGPPKGWDAEARGECRTLFIHVEDVDGLRRFTSAWRYTPAELEALNAGGEAFLSFFLPQHPVIQFWCQPRGVAEVVGDGLDVDVDGVPVDLLAPGAKAASLLDIGFAAMVEELTLQAEQRSNAPDIGDPDEAGQIFMSGVFAMRAGLEVALEAIGAAQVMRRQGWNAPAVATVPLMTLEGIAAEHQANTAIDAAGDDLRRELGGDELGRARKRADAADAADAAGMGDDEIDCCPPHCHCPPGSKCCDCGQTIPAPPADFDEGGEA